MNILELGAGIGTMTEMMLMGNYGAKTVFTTESNDFCLNALQKNLTNPKDPRLHILTTESDLNKITKPLDLIVGDGGFYSPLEFQNSKPGTILFFDGNRSKLRTIAHDTLTKKQLKCEMQKLGNDEKIAVWRFKHVLGIPLIPTRKKQRVSCWIGFVKPE
ncbi:MAG TPA: class I SAM-dependent methyltransferase [Verrucomicrobiae bacterium]